MVHHFSIHNNYRNKMTTVERVSIVENGASNGCPDAEVSDESEALI